MAEHSAVNRRVVGSSPTCGAIFLGRYETGDRQIARFVQCCWLSTPSDQESRSEAAAVFQQRNERLRHLRTDVVIIESVIFAVWRRC